MKFYFYWILILMTNVCTFGQTSKNHGFDVDELEKTFQEGHQQSLKKIEEREGLDKPWMLRVAKKVHEGDQVSNDELKRVWEIYRAEKNHKIEDKLVAFRLIAEVEDISKWQEEFDAFAYSEDPQFVKTAIQTLFWKLAYGTEREKIILSNKIAVLDRLVKFAEDNKADTTIDRDAVKINELAKPFVGKTPPAEVQRPDRRPSRSTADAIRLPSEPTPNPSAVESLGQRIGKGGILAFAGTIGIIIAVILIWRCKSKSTS
jgi:hypothetical protein